MASPADRRVDQEAVVRVRLLVMLTTDSGQFVEQRLRLFQIGGVEAFVEPAVNRSDEIASFDAPALLAPQPGEARGRAQFPELAGRSRAAGTRGGTSRSAAPAGCARARR